MNTTINIRIDTKTKKSISKVFDEMGLDISSAVKLFFNQVLSTESIPFSITTGRVSTSHSISKLKKEVAIAEKSGKRYVSTQALLNDILK